MTSTNKRKFTAIVSKGNNNSTSLEEGEEINPLPYVRLSRRNARGSQLSEAEMLETMAIKEVDPDRLLATKRIISAFNAGDVEAIHEIVFDAALDSTEVCFSNVQHVFVGKSALFSLWVSLFEAFPNGIFRTSDSVINEKKQVYTSFLFFGTKIFPLLIDGMPLELLSTGGGGGLGGVGVGDSFPLHISTQVTSFPFTHTPSHMHSHTPTLPLTNPPTPLPTYPSHYLLHTSSVIVDRNRPMFTTAELLETDSIPEMVFEGRIVLHMNEACNIRKFDFAWHRKM